MTSWYDTVFGAHGIGGRTDLPLPTGLAVTLAVLAVAFSFVALNIRHVGARPHDAPGRPAPAALQRLVDSTALREVLRVVLAAAVALVLVVALTGPKPEGLNVAPYALYITFWVGLVPASLLLGPVWRALNPLRLFNRVVDRLFGVRHDAYDKHPVPAWVGWWPAAAWLSAFVWLELVLPDRGNPRVVGAFVLGYIVLNRFASSVYGNAWLDRGDGFEAYSNVVASLGPWGRRADGRLVVRNPVDGALALPGEPGMLAVVLVLIGSTAFDGLTRTRFWVENVSADSVLIGTVGLTATVAAISGLYWGAMAVAARLAGAPASHSAAQTPIAVGAGAGTPHRSRASAGAAQMSSEVAGFCEPAGRTAQMARLFAGSLVPIAVGYAVAHYVSLFVYEGQGTWILLSDPLDTGADYLGTRVDDINYTWVSTTVIAYVQFTAIIAGHVLAVGVAHYRAVALFGQRSARRCQYPLMVLMLALTGMAVTFLVAS